MIRAERTGRCRLTATGHAGYAPAGQDIVCAAVSALVEALEAYLLLLQADGAGSAEISGACVAFEPADERDGRGEAAFDYAETGLRLIAKQYPRHVSFSSPWCGESRSKHDRISKTATPRRKRAGYGDAPPQEG